MISIQLEAAHLSSLYVYMPVETIFVVYNRYR